MKNDYEPLSNKAIIAWLRGLDPETIVYREPVEKTFNFCCVVANYLEDFTGTEVTLMGHSVFRTKGRAFQGDLTLEQMIDRWDTAVVGDSRKQVPIPLTAAEALKLVEDLIPAA